MGVRYLLFVYFGYGWLKIKLYIVNMIWWKMKKLIDINIIIIYVYKVWYNDI